MATGKGLITESTLTDIANAIRKKNHIAGRYKPSQMAAAILALPDAFNYLYIFYYHTSTNTYDSISIKILNGHVPSNFDAILDSINDYDGTEIIFMVYTGTTMKDADVKNLIASINNIVDDMKAIQLAITKSLASKFSSITSSKFTLISIEDNVE